MKFDVISWIESLCRKIVLKDDGVCNRIDLQEES
jgi:hypothetical protein